MTENVPTTHVKTHTHSNLDEHEFSTLEATLKCDSKHHFFLLVPTP